MPIVVAHQPNANLVGRAAYLAGQGQYQQYLDQLAMQAAQMQQRERLANQQMAFQAWQQQQDAARWQQAQDMANQRAVFDANAQFAGLQQRQAFDAQQAQAQRDWQADQYEQLRQANFAERQLGVDAQEDRYFMDWARKTPATLNSQGRSKFQQEMMAFQNIEADRAKGNLADPMSYAAARKAVRDRISGMDWSSFEGPDENQLQEEFEKTVVRNSTRFGPGNPVQIVTGRGGKLTEIPLQPVLHNGLWHLPNEGRDGVITMPDAVYKRWLSGEVGVDGKPVAKDQGDGEAGVIAKAQEAARAAQAKLVESVIGHALKTTGEDGLAAPDPAAIMQHYNEVYSAMGMSPPFPNARVPLPTPTLNPTAAPPTGAGASAQPATQSSPGMLSSPYVQAAFNPMYGLASFTSPSKASPAPNAATQQAQAMQQAVSAAPQAVKPIVQHTAQAAQLLLPTAPDAAQAAQVVTMILSKYGTQDMNQLTQLASPDEMRQLVEAMQAVQKAKQASAALLARPTP